MFCVCCLSWCGEDSIKVPVVAICCDGKIEFADVDNSYLCYRLYNEAFMGKFLDNICCDSGGNNDCCIVY